MRVGKEEIDDLYDSSSNEDGRGKIMTRRLVHDILRSAYDVKNVLNHDTEDVYVESFLFRISCGYIGGAVGLQLHVYMGGRDWKHVAATFEPADIVYEILEYIQAEANEYAKHLEMRDHH